MLSYLPPSYKPIRLRTRLFFFLTFVFFFFLIAIIVLTPKGGFSDEDKEHCGRRDYFRSSFRFYEFILRIISLH